MPKVRLIDANKLQEQLKRKTPEPGKRNYIEGFNDCLMKVKSMIHSAKPLDYEPVVHAHWIEDDDCQICSNCGEEHCWAEYRASYCEDCGAKMDEEVQSNANNNKQCGCY